MSLGLLVTLLMTGNVTTSLGRSGASQSQNCIQHFILWTHLKNHAQVLGTMLGSENTVHK